MKITLQSNRSRQVYSGDMARCVLALILCSTFLLSGCSDAEEDTESANQSRPSQSALGPKIKINAVTVSGVGSGNVAAGNAIDGDLTTQWSAGGAAPQWIQLDLGNARGISKVRLYVSQTPAGQTGHQVYAGPTPEQLNPIGSSDSLTQDAQWLEINAPAQDVRYVKIVTTKSPSWVAWREIEVY